MSEVQERDRLVAWIERETGGKVSFGYPAITRGGGWRATLHGGAPKLASVTLKRGWSQADALRALAASLGLDEVGLTKERWAEQIVSETHMRGADPHE